MKLGYLKEERAQTRERLDETRRVLEEVRVESRNAPPGVTEVVARGSVPDKPFEDKRKAMAMVGMMGGLGMGFGLIACLGHGFPDDPQRRRHSRTWKIGRRGGIARIAPGTSVDKLRASFHLALSRSTGTLGRTVAVIGGGKDSGATTLANALALSFQQTGARTALIDANLRSPALTERAGRGTEAAGITDWMSRFAAGLRFRCTQANGMTLLAAGRNRTVGDNAIAPRDVSRILEALASGNDIVVADCGSANRVLSSTLFAAQADLAVLVLRRGTSLGEARAAVASILAASRRQILVVLTGRPASPVPAWISKTVSASAEALAARFKKLRDKNSTGSTNHDREHAQEAPDNDLDDDKTVCDVLLKRLRGACPTQIEAYAIHEPVAVPGFDIYVVDNSFGGKQEGIRLAEEIAKVSPDASILMLSSQLEVGSAEEGDRSQGSRRVRQTRSVRS